MRRKAIRLVGEEEINKLSGRISSKILKRPRKFLFELMSTFLQIIDLGSLCTFSLKRNKSHRLPLGKGLKLYMSAEIPEGWGERVTSWYTD